MPKHFDINEKEIIYNRLIEEGKKSWGIHGIKRTSIDEICKSVGISKGSFYSFFDSKEGFFMEILEAWERDVKASLMENLLNVKGEPKQVFISTLRNVFNEVKSNPWFLRLMSDQGEYAALIRKQPEGRIENHILADDEDTGKLISLLGIELSDEEIRKISAALRALFVMLLHKEEIGEAYLDQVYELFLNGIADSVFGGISHDKS